MANPDWGTKRICQSCGTKFYDLQREPIICPKCGTEYDPEAFLKTRRTRPVSGGERDTQPSATAGRDMEDTEAEEDTETIEDEDDLVGDDEAGEEEDEDMIEDASELGEDDDDMAEVIENVDDEEER